MYKITKLKVEIIENIYKTKCVVAVNGKIVTRWWIVSGLQQGSPLNPTLLSLYLAGTKEYMKSGQEE